MQNTATLGENIIKQIQPPYQIDLLVFLPVRTWLKYISILKISYHGFWKCFHNQARNYLNTVQACTKVPTQTWDIVSRTQPGLLTTCIITCVYNIEREREREIIYLQPKFTGTHGPFQPASYAAMLPYLWLDLAPFAPFQLRQLPWAISTQPIWKVVYDRAVDEDRLGKHRASRYQQCFNNTLDWLRLDTAMAWETVCGQKARAPVVAFQGVIVKWFSCLASMDTSSGTNSLEFIAIIGGILPTSPGWCMSFDCFSLTAGKGLMIWSRM